MTNSYLNHKCLVSQGKYKPGSVHEKSLETIIHSISAGKNIISGYDMKSLGEGPDLVCVTLQCRGDSYRSKCRSCFASAMAGVTSLQYYLLAATRQFWLHVSENKIW